MLDFLIDHPDERFDGAALMRQLELPRHDEVARGFAALAADLAEHGLARPWNEAQAGYLLPSQHAAVLSRARRQVEAARREDIAKSGVDGETARHGTTY